MVGRVTSNGWFDFSVDPHYDADTGIFIWNFCHCPIEAIVKKTLRPIA